ncbi:MAG: peptide deformylase [Rhodobacterales bacterium]|nr:peptide deformylase [Rhodobacterales bacterium]
MAVLPIVTWPDPRLTRPCAPVGEAAGDPDVAQLAADMLETMYAAPGRGLAGPQVGVLRQIFVMDTGWRSGTPCPRVLIDPELLWLSDDRATGPEGCLSIPGLTTQVARARQVRIAWRDLTGARHQALLDGFDAICAQHEWDHLQGIVTLDRLAPADRAAALAQLAP